MGEGFLQTDDFFIIFVVCLQHILTDVVRYPQFFWRNQDEGYIFVTDQGLDQGMDGSAEFQIAAQTDGEVVQPSF